MSQGHIDHLLSEYIDGKLKHAMAEKVKSHLVFCNSCRRILRETEEALQKLKSLPAVDPPADLENKIISQIQASKATDEKAQSNLSASGPRFDWNRLFSVRSLALVTTCALVFIIVKYRPDRSAPSTSDASLSSDLKLKNNTITRGALKKIDPKKGNFAKARPEAQLVAVDLIAESESDQPQKMEKVVGGVAAVPIPKEKNQELKIKADTAESEAEDPTVIKDAEISRQPPPKSESRTEFKGDYSGIKEGLTTIINNKEEWQKLWDKHQATVRPKPALPDIDFKQNDLIAIFIPDQATGGYSLNINSIEETTWEGKPARVVEYTLKSPPEGSINSMAITQPYMMKIVPKFEGETFFRKRP